MTSRADAKQLHSEIWPEIKSTLARARELAISRKYDPLTFSIFVGQVSIDVFNVGAKARSRLDEEERAMRLEELSE